MANTKELRTQITSVKKTQKITRAMELVAASKVLKAQRRMEATRPYSEKIRQVVGHVANSHSEYHHPAMQKRDQMKRVGYIIVSTDRGLCGGLNVNLFRKSVADMRGWDQKDVELDLCLIGSKAMSFFKRHSAHVLAHTSHLGDAPEMQDLVGVVKIMLDAYYEGTLDAVYVAYNQFVNTMTQRPVISQLLPFEPAKDESASVYWDYIYEPDAKSLLDTLVTRYLELQVYQAVVENGACQQAASMVAMKSATDNAGEIINDLQLAFNKARQASITAEIAEIVGGAAALE